MTHVGVGLYKDKESGWFVTYNAAKNFICGSACDSITMKLLKRAKLEVNTGHFNNNEVVDQSLTSDLGLSVNKLPEVETKKESNDFEITKKRRTQLNSKPKIFQSSIKNDQSINNQNKMIINNNNFKNVKFLKVPKPLIDGVTEAKNTKSDNMIPRD